MVELPTESKHKIEVKTKEIAAVHENGQTTRRKRSVVDRQSCPVTTVDASCYDQSAPMPAEFEFSFLTCLTPLVNDVALGERENLIIFVTKMA